jgi:hypothetical protein
LANDEMPGRPASRAAAIHCGRSWPVSSVIMVANARTWPDAAWSSGQRSRIALRPGLLVLGQGVRAAGEPVRDVADGGRGRRQRLPGGAVPGEVVADDGVAAVVAEGLDLVEQAPDAAAGAVGVLAEVGLERVELARARSLPAAVDELLPGRGAVESLDGVQAPAQVTGDLPQAAPFSAASGPVRGAAGCARRTSRWGQAARCPLVPAWPGPALAGRAEAAARPGRSGGRRRTSRRPWRGSATGGTCRRPGPRPAPRSWRPRRTPPRGPCR